MAKTRINTSAIPGFDTMTAEQKVEALTNFEYDDYKDALDKANKESKERKDTINSNDATIKELREMVESLKKEQRMAETKSQFLGKGMDEDTAAKAAKAFVDGDMSAFGTAFDAFTTALAQKTKDEMLRGTPRPGGSTPQEGGKDYDKLIADAMARHDTVEAVRLTQEKAGFEKE